MPNHEQNSAITSRYRCITRPIRPRIPSPTLPMPPAALRSPPTSLDDNSRAGQKRPADDTAPHTPTGWPTQGAKHRGTDSGHQRPAHDTTTLTDDRRQQYTCPTYDMGSRPEQHSPRIPPPPTSPAILDTTSDQTRHTAMPGPTKTALPKPRRGPIPPPSCRRLVPPT